MTLLEVCEPLFHYVCFLNRSARKGGGVFDQSYVKGELKQIFTDMRKASAANPHLQSQYEKVELPLIFFTDAMIKYSKLPFALDWDDLAYERNELAGESKFFELLDRTLAEKNEAANERLAVFYTCLGLGFTGAFTGQLVDLRKKMLEISARIRGIVDLNTQSRICPEAYQYTDQRNLIEKPAKGLGGVAIVLAGMVVVLVATNIVLYRTTRAKLVTAIDGIAKDQPVPPQPAPATAPGDSAGAATTPAGAAQTPPGANPAAGQR